MAHSDLDSRRKSANCPLYWANIYWQFYIQESFILLSVFYNMSAFLHHMPIEDSLLQLGDCRVVGLVHAALPASC